MLDVEVNLHAFINLFSMFIDTTSQVCEICTVPYCAECTDATSCNVCIDSRELDVTGNCVKLQCDTSSLVLSEGQVWRAEYPLPVTCRLSSPRL